MSMPTDDASAPALDTKDADAVALTPGEVDELLANLDNLAAKLDVIYAQASDVELPTYPLEAPDYGSMKTVEEAVTVFCRHMCKVLKEMGVKSAAGVASYLLESEVRRAVPNRVNRQAEWPVAAQVKAACELDIAPFDAEFQMLQTEMRMLLEKAEEMRVGYQRLVAATDAVDIELDKLDVRRLHRCARARARHIRFITLLEEVWAIEPDDKCHCPPDAQAKMSRCCEVI